MLAKIDVQKRTETLEDLETKRRELFAALDVYLDRKNTGNRLSRNIEEREIPLAACIDQCNNLLDKELEILYRAQKILSLEKAAAQPNVDISHVANEYIKTEMQANLERITADLNSARAGFADIDTALCSIEREVHARSIAYRNYKKANADVRIKSGADEIIRRYADLERSMAELKKWVAKLDQEGVPDKDDEVFFRSLK